MGYENYSRNQSLTWFRTVLGFEFVLKGGKLVQAPIHISKRVIATKTKLGNFSSETPRSNIPFGFDDHVSFTGRTSRKERKTQ